MNAHRLFSLAGYAALLDAFRDLGYETRNFATVEVDKAHMILRHDVDMSIQAALRIAKLESERGQCATYFILLRTEMYNPFSGENRKDLESILTLGHDLGLHFDASLYAEGNYDEAVSCECDLMERFFGRRISVVSFHRPAQSLLGRPDAVAGRPHTYQPRFFSEMAYVSDSQGAWRYGHPLDHAAVSARRAIQLVTHPIWWVADEQETPQAKLDRFALGRLDLLRAELARNCKAYTAPAVQRSGARPDAL